MGAGPGGAIPFTTPQGSTGRDPQA